MTDKRYIKLAHGGGGQLTSELIEQVILPALAGPQKPGRLADSALLSANGPIAFTTDSYVVQPLEFPGGDIGKLAICGTVNDLAVCGATPSAISMSLVLEEGLQLDLLKRVLSSAGAAAGTSGVEVVTGDTKVVERGGVDGMVINTSGIGRIADECDLGFDRICQGDAILLSGPLGEHALAVMSQRESLSFTADLASDCAPIHELTGALVSELGKDVRFMRDPTRGGLAALLVDIAEATGRDIEIRQEAIPTNKTARAAAEMLGLDLLVAANEGKLVAVVANSAAERATQILERFDICDRPAAIGHVGTVSQTPLVEMVTLIEGRTVVQRPYGEELPRIC